MRKTSLVLLLAIFVGVQLSASKTISGIVIESKTGKPVKDAAVSTVGPNYYAFTDAKGKFELVSAESDYHIQVHVSGYENMVKDIKPGDGFVIFSMQTETPKAPAAHKPLTAKGKTINGEDYEYVPILVHSSFEW